MPATPVLARPTSVTTGLILSGGTSSGVSTAGDDFYIKVVSARHRHRTPIADISGDGDFGQNLLPSYWMSVDWMIRGHLIASQLMGIAKMQLTANNPTGTTLVKFDLSSGNTLSGRFVIAEIVTEYLRNASTVGISILLRTTVDLNGAVTYVEALT